MQTRREVVLGGFLSIGFGFGAACPCHAQGLSSHSIAGCLIGDDELPRVYPIGTPTTKYVHGSEPIIYSSGDRNLDRALAQTLAKCGDLFGVVPGFAFFDDSASPNAYATGQVRMQRADGTVLKRRPLQFGTIVRRLPPPLEVERPKNQTHEEQQVARVASPTPPRRL
jgi:hypothetical protein